MNDGRIHETPGSQTKDNLFNSHSQTVSIFVLVPQTPISTGWHKEDSMMSVCVVGLIAAEETWVYGTESFIIGGKHTRSLFQRVTLCLSSQAIGKYALCSRGRYYFNLLRQFINILENWIQNKRIGRALIVRHEEPQEIHGKLSFNRQLVFIQANLTVHVFWRN